MSSTNMSYYAILSDYLLAVKSGSRWAVSSDGIEWVGGSVVRTSSQFVDGRQPLPNRVMSELPVNRPQLVQADWGHTTLIDRLHLGQ